MSKFETIKSHWVQYRGDVTELQGLPVSMYPFLPSNVVTGTDVFRHLESVRAFDTRVRSAVRNWNIATETDFVNCSNYIAQATDATTSIKKSWRDRQKRLDAIYSGLTNWYRYNEAVRSYYLTDLMSEKQGAFMSIPFGEDGGNVANHRYLLGMLNGLKNDQLYGDDGDDDHSSTGEAAQKVVVDYVNKAGTAIHSLKDKCKRNMDNAIEARNHVDTHRTHHASAIDILDALLTDLLYDLYDEKLREWTAVEANQQVPGTQDDSPGGAGS